MDRIKNFRREMDELKEGKIMGLDIKVKMVLGDNRVRNRW